MGRKVCKSTFLHSLLCGKKILVVDHNKVNLRVDAGALKKFGAADCIKDCNKAVERGRELWLDFKMIARALTRKGTALVKIASFTMRLLELWDCLRQLVSPWQALR
ncbi:hypothetical protein Fot_33052 [Forsythia ovata]|uniref:Dephospho-CoA kinase n=1 Tax=Forsythia ovata TaxID=205694 RepID=A0ABD1T9Z9_9LAMI